MQETNPNPNNKQQARNKAIRIFVIILIVVAILAGLYWLIFIRGEEETDDAYVEGNQVAVSAQVDGTVKQINFSDTDYVKQGDVLLELSAKDRELALAQAENQLVDTVRKERNLYFTIQQLKSALAQKEISVKQTKTDYNRQLRLMQTNSTTAVNLAHSKDAYESALASYKSTESQLKANQVLWMDTPLREQPAIKSAVNAVRNAWLNLQRTKILSPVSGYVAKRSVQVGETIGAGRPLMAVVPADQMWVDANFKETQIKDIRIGQKAKIVFDVYGDSVKFDGVVTGIEMGTGSAFSLLPAQNATGNWIKIVQRVPVRIELKQDQLKKYPLRLGLSATVKVAVSDTSGKTLRPAKETKALYSTDVLQYDENTLNQRIEQIIKANMDGE